MPRGRWRQSNACAILPRREAASPGRTRAWRAARRIAFTPEVVAGPLGATPYTLRHACVSTWLNGGVSAPQVAEWAGHSVEVLLKVYAKCVDGQDAIARRRAEQALGYLGRA